jgi:hypothetical protein
MANISDFKAQMIGGGARPNQFRVELAFPEYVTAGVVAGQQAQFLCKAAQLPGSTIDTVPIQYRGRAINFAGERTFAPWSIQVYNDTNFNIRNAMEQWQAGIQNYGTTQGRVNPRDYQVDMAVHQLDRNGATVKSYRFVDAFPTVLGPVALDYDAVNTLEIFDVEFVFNYFTSNTTEGAAGVGVNISIDTPIGTFPLPI